MRFLQLNIGVHELSDVKILVCHNDNIVDVWRDIVKEYEDKVLFSTLASRFELNSFIAYVKMNYYYTLTVLDVDSVATIED